MEERRRHLRRHRSGILRKAQCGPLRAGNSRLAADRCRYAAGDRQPFDGWPRYYPTLIGSSLFEQQRTRAGVTGSVEWRTSDDKAELNLSGFYSHLNADNYNDNYMLWGSHEFANNLPTSYTVKQRDYYLGELPAPQSERDAD